MAQTECGRGHVYDSDIYPSCPYCNSDRVSFVFGRETAAGSQNGVAEDIGKTVAGRGTMNGENIVTHVGPGSTAAEDIGKTTIPEELKKQQQQKESDEVKKTTYVGWKESQKIKPTVGWLVCISGPEKGKDFRLHAGNNNSIGRSQSMDVCIRKDLTVSEEYQARIAYDARYNSFFFIPGEKSTNINYVNRQTTLTQVQLKPYDCIEFGESQFLFVPFCCDRFTWEKGQGTEDFK